MGNEPQTAVPVINYNLRHSQNGQWLWMFSVTKGGVPFRVMNWDGVAAQANQYEFHPQFIDDGDSAWIGTLNAAQSIQHILSARCDIIADICERGTHALVSEG
jgi:predicted nicotinamide N-methyase